jgi:hypothetical protein
MEKEFGKKCITEETLEEAAEIGDLAEKKYLKRLDNFQKVDFKDGVFEGAKWMQERMYNEEELEVAFFEGRENNLPFTEWFEKFKKK